MAHGYCSLTIHSHNHIDSFSNVVAYIINDYMPTLEEFDFSILELVYFDLKQSVIQVSRAASS